MHETGAEVKDQPLPLCLHSTVSRWYTLQLLRAGGEGNKYLEWEVRYVSSRFIYFFLLGVQFLARVATHPVKRASTSSISLLVP